MNALSGFLYLKEVVILGLSIDDVSIFQGGGVKNRDYPRFFDQVGHQTTNASIGNKLFFTK